GQSLDIVDGVHAGEPEPAADALEIEAPRPVGEPDLLAVDRAGDAEDRALRPHAALVEITADRRFRAGHRLVVDHDHALGPAARLAPRQARAAAADIREGYAGQ